MQVNALVCPQCFAPLTPAAALSVCRYCGASLAIHGAPAVAPLQSGALFLEDCGPNKIGIIKVLRENLKLGLREAKELSDRAPCVVGEALDPTQRDALRLALIKAQARVR